MVSNDDSPTVKEAFESGEALYYVFWGLCIFFFVVLLFVVGPHIIAHLKMARRPKGRFRSENKEQVASRHHINWYKTVILTSLPILSFISILSVTFLKQGVLMEFFLVIVEGIVLTVFFFLCQEYLGGPKHFQETLRDVDHAEKIWATIPCCCLRHCTKPDKIDSPKKVRFFEIIILQTAIVRPLLYLIALILQGEGKYHEDDKSLSSSRLIIQYLSFISLVFCIYGLLSIYRAGRPVLSKYNAGLQFIAVKLMFVFAVVQTLVLSFLAARNVVGSNGIFTGDDIAVMLQSMLFTFELIILAELFKRSFPLNHITDIEPLSKDTGATSSDNTDLEQGQQIEMPEMAQSQPAPQVV
eukprot:Clim_evm3s9 gene=Clim_evmTU3s9